MLNFNLYSTQYEKIDRRRDRVYGAIIRHYVGGVVPAELPQYNDRIQCMELDGVKGKVQTLIAEALPQYKIVVNASVEGHNGWGDRHKFVLSARCICYSTKPSLIISEDDIMAETQSVVNDIFADVIGNWLLEVKEAHHQNKVLDQTDRIGSHFMNECRKIAEKTVRYKQRIDALKAELLSEIEQVAHDEIDEFSLTDDWEDGVEHLFKEVYKRYLPTAIYDGLMDQLHNGSSPAKVEQCDLALLEHK